MAVGEVRGSQGKSAQQGGEDLGLGIKTPEFLYLLCFLLDT